MRRRRRLGTVLALLALVVLALAGGWLGRRAYTAPGPLPTARAVVVPHGNVMVVADSLRQAGVIASPLAFRLAVEATARQGPLHAAELAFPAHASLRRVLLVLRHAPPVAHLITIPEGLTALQIQALLDRALALAGPAPLPAEGSVLPQTYSYEWGTTRAALEARMQAAMRTALARAWAQRAPDPTLTTPKQAVILASMVERETALPAERPRIAAVFLNRLRLGMRLQSDPTVIYAVSHGTGLLDRPLSKADLATPSPYNTYHVAGLPPGPICAPGIASIEAVLHPAASPDLYFVADGSGGHRFAATLAGQNRNVAKWRALQK